ncbi:MAG: hypothetical protein SNF60_06545 [Rikenellaceae bacterium]
MKIKVLILTSLILLGGIIPAIADGEKGDPEVLYKYRFGVNLQVKLAKGLKLELEPEFRFCDGYDKLLLNAGLSYKTFGCIYWGATYRLDIDRQDSEASSSTMSYMGRGDYDSEVYHRYAFDISYKEGFGRFTPSFRLRYNNFADDDVTDKEFLRYRAKVEYNIRKCKISPYAAL